jgi:hypothetical protein
MESKIKSISINDIRLGSYKREIMYSNYLKSKIKDDTDNIITCCNVNHIGLEFDDIVQKIV